MAVFQPTLKDHEVERLFSISVENSRDFHPSLDKIVGMERYLERSSSMNKIPLKLQPWFEARRRFKLSHAHVQMARELGMNPKNLGSVANVKQQPWKLPLPEFIAACYFKHFGRHEPTEIRSLEQLVEADELKRQLKKERKANTIA